MASSTHRSADPARWPRRDAVVYIYLPFALVFALVVLGVVAVAILPRQSQVSIVADWLLTILVLCPAMLCLFPLCILAVALAAGVGKLNGMAYRPMRRLAQSSENVAAQAASATDTINRRMVDLSARFAYVDRLLSAFDPPANGDEPGTNHDQQEEHNV